MFLTDSAAAYSVRAATLDDREKWCALFREYTHVGGVVLSSDQIDEVWSWICSDARQTCCLLGVEDEVPIGLVHFRQFERPITASTGLWIDDLYVRPSSRGKGIAVALIDAVRAEARAGGHDVVRWTTRESNAGARRLYDRIAVRAPVSLYNAEPSPRG